MRLIPASPTLLDGWWHYDGHDSRSPAHALRTTENAAYAKTLCGALWMVTAAYKVEGKPQCKLCANAIEKWRAL